MVLGPAATQEMSPATGTDQEPPTMTIATVTFLAAVTAIHVGTVALHASDSRSRLDVKSAFPG